MELHGHTEILSLFDLAQVLSVNEATGMLTVVDEDGERGWLYFQRGDIINAMDAEHQEGEDAAKRVFASRRAEYAFRTDLPSVARRITVGTQNLVMEIARQLDEETAEEGAPRVGDRLLEVQQATAALNEIFSRLDTESKILSHRSRQGWSVGDLLDPIRDTPEAVLYLRPDARPEVRAGGRMIPVSETALDRESYESLRDHMLREAHGGVQLPDEPTEGVLALGDQGAWRIEVAKGSGAEVTTIRRIGDAQSLETALPWPGEDVDALLAPPGSIVLIVSPAANALDGPFTAVVDRFVRQTGGPVVGMGRGWPPGLGGGRAAVVLLNRLSPREMAHVDELADRLDPALLALDDSDCREGLVLALRAAKRGSRVVMGVCARTAAYVGHRLAESMPPGDRALVAPALGLGLTGVLMVGRGGERDPSVHPIEDATRRALVGGDLGELARQLATTARASSASIPVPTGTPGGRADAGA